MVSTQTINAKNPLQSVSTFLGGARWFELHALMRMGRNHCGHEINDGSPSSKQNIMAHHAGNKGAAFDVATCRWRQDHPAFGVAFGPSWQGLALPGARNLSPSCQYASDTGWRPGTCSAPTVALCIFS